MITTGGLGPTKDDLTKETIAEALELPLAIHQESLDYIRCFFEKQHRRMCDNNVKQAYLPSGCKVIPNRNGTAPGCIVQKGGKTVVMLPGPPKEMIPMFEDTVFPYFEGKPIILLGQEWLKSSVSVNLRWKMDHGSGGTADQSHHCPLCGFRRDQSAGNGQMPYPG